MAEKLPQEQGVYFIQRKSVRVGNIAVEVISFMDDSVLEFLICYYNCYTLTDVTVTFQVSALNVTRQTIYVLRKTEARSFNHCCSGKEISIAYLGVCVCSLWYQACNTNAPYFYLWPVRLYSILHIIFYR